LEKEDDEDAEIVYLLGWTYYLLGGGSTTEEIPNEYSINLNNEMIKYWENSRECLNELFTLIEKGTDVDNDVVEHAKMVFAFVDGVLRFNGVGSDNEDTAMQE
jgi:hypothetical protein